MPDPSTSSPEPGVHPVGDPAAGQAQLHGAPVGLEVDHRGEQSLGRAVGKVVGVEVSQHLWRGHRIRLARRAT